MGDAEKENQWQEVGEDKQTNMESWLETAFLLGTRWKIALQGNKPHLSRMPASQKSNKEDDSSQKETVVDVFAGNVTEEGKGKTALSQSAAALF